MKTGIQACKEKGVQFNNPDGTPRQRIPVGEFQAAGLNPVVRCTGCEMTMAICSASVRVDDEGYTWCKTCAEGREEVA